MHQSIKAYFEQFSGGGDSFGAARQKLKEKLFSQSLTMEQLDNEDDTRMMGYSGDSDDEAKLAALNYANDCVLNFNSGTVSALISFFSFSHAFRDEIQSWRA